jgi:hypothetical protein
VDVKSLYRAGSSMTVAKEIPECKLDFFKSTGSQMGQRWHRTSR